MSLNNDEIESFLNDMDKDSRATLKEIAKMCWFMRGSVSYTEALELSHSERENIKELIENNIKITTESKMPFF